MLWFRCTCDLYVLPMLELPGLCFSGAWSTGAQCVFCGVGSVSVAWDYMCFHGLILI